MYYFIVNPKSRSGRGHNVWLIVKEELDKKQVEYEVYFTKHHLHATTITSDICAKVSGIKKIVVLGGDGTVDEVINGIKNFEEVILGYIPSGSSNDFARSLHISNDPLTALHAILLPKQYKYVDIGELTTYDATTSSKRYFMVSSGIGYDASVCYEALNSNIKNILNRFKLGKLTYIVIALKQLIQCQPAKGRLIIDGKEYESSHRILFLANMIHKYEGGGLLMAPTANYSDKKLNVCFVRDVPKLKVFFLLPSIFFGKHTIFKGIDLILCDHMELNLETAMVTHSDGEYAGHNIKLSANCNQYSIRIML